MKGFELGTGLLIAIGVIILLAFIYFIIVQSNIIPYKNSADLDFKISQLCPDWTKQSCSETSALNDLKLMVGSSTKTLAEMCSLYFTGVENKWDSEVYAKCKKKCISCPATTTV